MPSSRPVSRCGQARSGTLGELSPKPHPWLYAEVAAWASASRSRSGIGWWASRTAARACCAIRLAGFAAIGIGGGNIDESGAGPLCTARCDTLEDALGILL